jgi:hypothetical protein
MMQLTERERAWERYPDDARELLLAKAAPQRRCGQPLCQAPMCRDRPRKE